MANCAVPKIPRDETIRVILRQNEKAPKKHEVESAAALLVRTMANKRARLDAKSVDERREPRMSEIAEWERHFARELGSRMAEAKKRG